MKLVLLAVAFGAILTNESVADGDLWVAEDMDMFCPKANIFNDVSNQQDCQNKCYSSVGCVGIAYSRMVSKAHRCFVCLDDALSSSPTQQNDFYRKPTGANMAFYQGFCRYGSDEKNLMGLTYDFSSVEECYHRCELTASCTAVRYTTYHTWSAGVSENCALYTGGPYTDGNNNPDARCYIMPSVHCINSLHCPSDRPLCNPDGFCMGVCPISNPFAHCHGNFCCSTNSDLYGDPLDDSCKGCLNNAISCETQPCTHNRDCVWGEYGEWSDCSFTCGVGTRTRTRPEATPQGNGGAPCTGSATETETCNPDECPGNGYEITASSYCSPETEAFYALSEAKRQCSDDPSCTMLYDVWGQGNIIWLCGVGAQILTSGSNSIVYKKRLVSCVGDASTWDAGYGKCNTYATSNKNWCDVDFKSGHYAYEVCKECGKCGSSVAIDCVWREYGAWSTCSASCGDGTRTRTRTEATTAQNGGAACTGSNTETEVCNDGTCPGLGKYGTQLDSTCEFPRGKTGSRFATLADAKEKCDAKRDCKMFYRDTRGAFHTCPPGSRVMSKKKGYQLYTKPQA